MWRLLGGGKRKDHLWHTDHVCLLNLAHNSGHALRSTKKDHLWYSDLVCLLNLVHVTLVDEGLSELKLF